MYVCLHVNMITCLLANLITRFQEHESRQKIHQKCSVAAGNKLREGKHADTRATPLFFSLFFRLTTKPKAKNYTLICDFLYVVNDCGKDRSFTIGKNVAFISMLTDINKAVKVKRMLVISRCVHNAFLAERQREERHWV